MNVTSLTPVLNVSNLQESFTWFERLGWERGWEWGDPSRFGGVSAGAVEIYLCLNGQGGRGKGSNTTTFRTHEDQRQDKGAWVTLWVEDVDDVYRHCLENDIEVTLAPKSMPWNVREMHVRHPDGHVFRVTCGLAESAHLVVQCVDALG